MTGSTPEPTIAQRRRIHFALANGGRPSSSVRVSIFQSGRTACATIVYSHITKDPQVCGGKACIDGTRVRVLDLVCMLRQALSPQDMLGAYPSLTLAQVYAALSYYHENPQEISADLDRDREAAERIEADRADFLSR